MEYYTTGGDGMNEVLGGMTLDHLEIVYWPIDKPILYIRNPRKNDSVVDRMVSSIKEFGFKIPILVKSDGTVIDGHLRLKAARKMNMPEIPVIITDNLTDTQVKAFRLLANRSVNWAEWDMELLALEIEDLRGLEFDLELTGFDASELAGMTAVVSEPEAPADFKEVDENLETEHTCPKCGYRFSGGS